MYVCIECGNLFENPIEWVETHGLDTPPYEHWSGSPCCRSNYTEAFRCNECDDWITGDYIRVGDKRYCDSCYSHMELGDE